MTLCSWLLTVRWQKEHWHQFSARAPHPHMWLSFWADQVPRGIPAHHWEGTRTPVCCGGDGLLGWIRFVPLRNISHLWQPGLETPCPDRVCMSAYSSQFGIWGITACPQVLFGFQSLDFMSLFLLSHLPDVWPSVGCIITSEHHHLVDSLPSFIPHWLLDLPVSLMEGKSENSNSFFQC